MPKDEWARARAKDAARRIQREKRANRRPEINRRRKQKASVSGHPRCLFFGKFKEVPFESVPTWYLTWVLREVKTLKDAVRRRIENVLRTRRKREQTVDLVGATQLPPPPDPGGAPF